MYEGVVQDLIDELGQLPGVGPKGAQRIAFHLLAADPPPGRDLLGAQSLMDEVEPFVQGRSVGVTGPVLGRRPDGHPAHRLDPAADDDVHGAGHDRLGGEVDGLLRRATLPVDRRAGHRVGEARSQGGVAPDVHGLLAHGHGAAHDDVLDEGGVQVVALDEGLERRGGEVHGVPARQLAVAPPHRGAYRVDDDGVGHARPPAPGRASRPGP